MTPTVEQPVSISVIVVVMNMLQELRNTVDSVLRLNDPRINLYVVDGASKDGTPAYLGSLPGGFVTWISERDQGIYDAMNKGWSMALKESFVLYLGAGDTLLSVPQDAALKSHLVNGRPIVLGDCRTGDSHFWSTWSKRLYVSNTAHHQALLIYKPVQLEPPFDPTLRVYGDWELNLRLFKRGLLAANDADLKTTALAGGVSARHDLAEIWRVALRHGGVLRAVRSLLVNTRAELRLRLARHT